MAVGHLSFSDLTTTSTPVKEWDRPTEKVKKPFKKSFERVDVVQKMLRDDVILTPWDRSGSRNTTVNEVREECQKDEGEIGMDYSGGRKLTEGFEGRQTVHVAGREATEFPEKRGAFEVTERTEVAEGKATETDGITEPTETEVLRGVKYHGVNEAAPKPSNNLESSKETSGKVAKKPTKAASKSKRPGPAPKLARAKPSVTTVANRKPNVSSAMPVKSRVQRKNKATSNTLTSTNPPRNSAVHVTFADQIDPEPTPVPKVVALEEKSIPSNGSGHSKLTKSNTLSLASSNIFYSKDPLLKSRLSTTITITLKQRKKSYKWFIRQYPHPDPLSQMLLKY